MTLQVIKKKKRYGRTDGRTHGQRENSIPHHKQSLRGYNNKGVDQTVACGDFCRLLITLANSLIFVKMAWS